jgi:hypothetical protein
VNEEEIHTSELQNRREQAASAVQPCFRDRVGQRLEEPPPEMPEMFRDVYYHSLDAPTMLQIAEKTTVTMERRLGVQLRLSTV